MGYGYLCHLVSILLLLHLFLLEGGKNTVENVLPLVCLKASTGLLIKIILDLLKLYQIQRRFQCFILSRFVPFWTTLNHLRNYLSLRLINTFLRNIYLAVSPHFKRVPILKCFPFALFHWKTPFQIVHVIFLLFLSFGQSDLNIYQE